MESVEKNCKKDETTNRKTYLDIAKGILIILVIIGHSKLDKTFPIVRNIYWFHMPTFFIISGYLFKPYKNDFILWFNRKFKIFFIPYMSYSLIILLILYHSNIKMLIKQCIKYIYSGRLISGAYWFIPCLFLTEIVFGLLVNKFKKRNIIFLLIIIYLLAHLESIYYIPKDNNYFYWSYIYKIPWNADVCLVSLPYFGVGFYCKKIINSIDENFKLSVFFLLCLICITLTTASYYKILNYSLDMKLSHYSNILLDIIIPVTFTIWIIMLSKLISYINISRSLAYIGMNTLPIMYLHLPINEVLLSYHNYGNLIFIIVGFTLPLCFAYVCSKSKKLKFYFIGTNSKKISIK